MGSYLILNNKRTEKMKKMSKTRIVLGSIPIMLCINTSQAVPVDGGTLVPTTIPKYVTPLVIPPVMKHSGTANEYDIAVRQFQQQILPGGIWNTVNGRTDAFPATTIWSYGPAADPTPGSSPRIQIHSLTTRPIPLRTPRTCRST